MSAKSKLAKVARGLGWGVAGLALVVAGLVVADGLHERTCPAPELAGRVVSIPGERMEFVRADARELAFDTTRDPDPPDFTLRPEDGHLHPNQAERFEVVEGRARFLIGDREVVLEPGQSAVVPPNTLHHWMALDGKPVRVRGSYEPALDTGAFFVSFHGAIDRGEMNLLRAAVIVSEFPDGSPVPVEPSPRVWNFLVKILAPIGRLLGYRAC